LGSVLAFLAGDAMAQRFRFERFTSADGLASSLVFGMDRDEAG